MTSRYPTLLGALTLLATVSAQAQTSGPGNTPTPTSASFRGLGIARDGTIWASGTQGTVLRSPDGGKTWELRSIPDAASFDLRDIEPIDAKTAYAMVAGADTARIYKTTDGGKRWTQQYDDTRKGIFLDGIAFWDAKRGIAFGDPMDGRFVILRTDDGGKRWTQLPPSQAPEALPGEAAFAASGTSITAGRGGRVWIGTGAGPAARVLRSSDYGQTWEPSESGIPAGTSSTGVFSLAFRDTLRGIAVGGDYANPDSARVNVATTVDGGKTWRLADTMRVTRYLSAVAYIPGTDTLIAVGTTGTFRSGDGGWTWTRLGSVGYNAVAASRRFIAAASGKGRLAVWPSPEAAAADSLTPVLNQQ